MNKIKIFYGWFVVAACFLFQLIGMGLGMGTSNLYIKPICDGLGFSRGAFSLVFSIISIVNMIVCLTFGMVHKKVGSRSVYLIGVLCEAGAFAIYGFATNIYLFYVGAVLMGVGLIYLGQISFSLVISNWFIDQKGVILGFVFAGSAIGGTILNPLTGSWILAYGWRASYLISMVIVVVFSVPALLLIHEKPSDVGLAAYGAAHPNILTGADDPNGLAGVTYNEALHSSPLWLLLIAALFYGMAIQTIYLTAPAYLADVGLQLQSVALAMGIVYFFNLAGKILLGIVNDKFGIRPVVLISHGFFILAAIILIFTRNNTAAYLFALFFGIGAVALSIPIPLITEALFGRKDFGTLLGMIMAAYAVGVSIGTPLNGLSFDIFHTYVYAFVFQIILDIVAVILILAALKNHCLIPMRKIKRTRRTDRSC